MSPIDKPHSLYRHLYAVVRIDLPVSSGDPHDSVAVVKVYPSRETAEGEAARLNEVNADKHCTYSVHATRMSATR